MKMKYGSRAEWLEGRRKGIGASEWAPILRDHFPIDDRDLLYSSPYEIWAEKTGAVPPTDLTDVERVEWGLRHEPAIAQAIMDRTGREVILAEEFTNYRSDVHKFLMASPDSFQKRKDRPDPGVLQIKTTDSFMKRYWIEEGQRRPPLAVKFQVLAEMFVTGCQWGSVAVLIGGNELWGPFDIDRQDPFYDAAVPELAKFWELVETKTPPPADESESTFEILKKLYPEANGPSVELGEEFVGIVEEIQQQAKIRLAADKREKELKALIAAAMKDAGVAHLPNGHSIFYPTIPRSGYTVQPSTYRKFTFK